MDKPDRPIHAPPERRIRDSNAPALSAFPPLGTAPGTAPSERTRRLQQMSARTRVFIGGRAIRVELVSWLAVGKDLGRTIFPDRSEEHTSELQSRRDLVCRLLL